MARVLAPSELTAVVNTGDDFEHWGLTVCPDLDTCMYTLAELSDEVRGWGLRDETFNARDAVRRLGGADWFALGDRDLGTHLVRTEALRADDTLTAVTARLCDRLGVHVSLLPMCDAPRRTVIDTFELGALPFQEWLVKHGAPAVQAVRFVGELGATSQVHEAIERADLIVIGPSNPYVSIDPILSLEGVRQRVARKRVIAVSPIVAGRAIKGPLADMIRTLAGKEPGVLAIAEHYRELLSGFVVERGDEDTALDMPVLATETVMRDVDARVKLAREVLTFAESLP
jgi:LPPG:FO 2-phospho-L-lactate transferase